MHSVKRGDEPESLKNNKVQWTSDLLQQKTLKKGNISSVEDKYKNQYKQEDVKSALKKMYEELCCYCEGNIGLTGYEEIEHYKPKSKYTELCFEWTNLHQICPKCNKKKNDKWNDDFPILSPTDDTIEEHLFFENVLLLCDEEDIRGRNTISHLKLNEREEILNLRTRLYQKALEYSHKSDADKAIFRDLISLQRDYPTFRRYLIALVNKYST